MTLPGSVLQTRGYGSCWRSGARRSRGCGPGVMRIMSCDPPAGTAAAELERRLGMDSTDSGTPSSREWIGAKEARKARQQSERERSKDRKRGGQPGHHGKGPQRGPDPDQKETADPPAECRSCRASLDGAEAAGAGRAQVIDVEMVRKPAEWALPPGLACGCCGAVTFAGPPPGLHAGSVSYGPALNAAAVLLSAYGNVPAERSAQLLGMLLGTEVSAGWVGKAVARVSARLDAAGFGDAMTAALAGQGVLAADETPVNVQRTRRAMRTRRRRTRRRRQGRRTC